VPSLFASAQYADCISQ